MPGMTIIFRLLSPARQEGLLVMQEGVKVLLWQDQAIQLINNNSSRKKMVNKNFLG